MTDRRRQLMTEFANKFQLLAVEDTVDSDTFFMVIKPGADPDWHGWILAESEDSDDQVLYEPHADHYAYDGWIQLEDVQPDGMYVHDWQDRVTARKLKRIANGPFAHDGVTLYGDGLSLSLPALERMIQESIDPYGRQIKNAIESWSP